ncbi:30S ribosomal protein S6e [Candidatus Woesearchaeota archaeon CG10_big_fil_rev_8_21_14_0_10_34_12]|nr:MAG: 30S ribosomal protein S6e [Candidatus Woesearchaeota archaeon CG10_big_fil_rev_8_21_14_0_10_34_12]
MVFKINISENGKTFKLETESETLEGKKINETIKGEEILPALQGYELKITGTSDKAGFPGNEEIDSTILKRILLSKGKFMKTKKPRGLRLRKTVRGNTISKDVVQINTVVGKKGSKKLEEAFPDQNKPKEEKKEEAKPEEKKE